MFRGATKSYFYVVAKEVSHYALNNIEPDVSP